MDPSAKRNTDEFAVGPFRPHGRVDVWAEGNVMWLEATGPLNKESVIALGSLWRSLFAEFHQVGPYASITVIHRSLINSQEVLDALEDFLAANTQAGNVASAAAFVVAPDVEGRAFMLPKYAEIYTAAGRPFAAFTTEAEAEAWVRAKLQEHPARPAN